MFAECLRRAADTELFPPRDRCRLIYDKHSRTSSAPPGVDIRVPGFGQTYSLEFLDPSKRDVGEFKPWAVSSRRSSPQKDFPKF